MQILYLIIAITILCLTLLVGLGLIPHQFILLNFILGLALMGR